MIWLSDRPERQGFGENTMILVTTMVANAVVAALGIIIKRIKKKIKKVKENLYQRVNQGYQRAISPLSKLYFGHFSGYLRAYLSTIAA